MPMQKIFTPIHFMLTNFPIHDNENQGQPILLFLYEGIKVIHFLRHKRYNILHTRTHLKHLQCEISSTSHRPFNLILCLRDKLEA